MDRYSEIAYRIKEFNDEEVSKDYRTILICACYLLDSEYFEFCRYEKIANKKIDKQLKKQFKKEDLFNYLKGLNIKDYSSFLNEMLDYIKENDKQVQKYTGLEINNDLSNLIIDLFELKNEEVVLDLCSNNGRFLNNLLLKTNSNLNLKVIGEEVSEELCDLSSILLSLNHKPYEIINSNLIKDNKSIEFNKCLIFPPFGLKLDENTFDKYIKYSNGLINQRSSPEWIFILNALNLLSNDSKIITLIQDNILFKTYDSDIRKYLINNNLIEGIISLPSDIFKGYSFKTSLLIISKNNESFKLLDSEEILNYEYMEYSINKSNRFEEIYNKYRSNSVLKIKKNDIKSLDYNLTYKSLSNSNLYNDLSNTKKLEEICDILKGCNLTYTNFKDLIVEEETRYKILTSGDIDEDGCIDYSNLKSILNGEKYFKYFAKKGDIVITSKSTKTKLALIDLKENENIIIASSMTILRPKEDLLDTIYLKMFLDSQKGKKILESIQMGNIIVTISLKELALIQIPYIALEKQKKKANMYKKWLEVYELRKKQVKSLETILENFYDLTLNKEKI